MNSVHCQYYRLFLVYIEAACVYYYLLSLYCSRLATKSLFNLHMRPQQHQQHLLKHGYDICTAWFLFIVAVNFPPPK